jgi:hypothetical protein
MKFVAFRLDIASKSGIEAAFRLEQAFDESEVILVNKTFLLENLN